MEKLTKAYFNKHIKNYNPEHCVGPIPDRVHYILDDIYGQFDDYLDACWYVYGAEESCLGDLESIFDNERVCMGMLVLNPSPPKKSWSAILKGKVWDLSSYFPKRWLFEDFEEELEDGIIAYRPLMIRKEKLEKKAKETKKQNELAMIKSIIAKLNDEQSKFIKRKLKVKEAI